eukprot:1325134-Pleurochrysis_carterae.AAC.1
MASTPASYATLDTTQDRTRTHCKLTAGISIPPRLTHYPRRAQKCHKSTKNVSMCTCGKRQKERDTGRGRGQAEGERYCVLECVGERGGRRGTGSRKGDARGETGKEREGERGVGGEGGIEGENQEWKEKWARGRASE